MLMNSKNDGAPRNLSKTMPRHTGFAMDTAKTLTIVLQLRDICKEASLVNTTTGNCTPCCAESLLNQAPNIFTIRIITINS